MSDRNLRKRKAPSPVFDRTQSKSIEKENPVVKGEQRVVREEPIQVKNTPAPTEGLHGLCTPNEGRGVKTRDVFKEVLSISSRASGAPNFAFERMIENTRGAFWDREASIEKIRNMCDQLFLSTVQMHGNITTTPTASSFSFSMLLTEIRTTFYKFGYKLNESAKGKWELMEQSEKAKENFGDTKELDRILDFTALGIH